MATGHIECLKRGFRAVVYAGKDPLTGRKTYLKETHPTREAAQRAKDRLVAQVEAERIPDQAATVAYLLDRWVEVAEHELSTRVTNEGYIRRTLKPALGDLPLRGSAPKSTHRPCFTSAPAVAPHLRRAPWSTHRLGPACETAGCQRPRGRWWHGAPRHDPLGLR
jgi:hypothetical protein